MERLSVDLKEIWKSTGYYRSSLSAVAFALGVPTPKSDISGADVGRVYWDEGDLERIAAYCGKDVVCTANVFRRLRYEDLLDVKFSNPEIDFQPLLIHLVAGGEYGDRERDLLNKIASDPEIDNKKAKVILDAVTSTSKYQKTKITKKDVKDILK